MRSVSVDLRMRVVEADGEAMVVYEQKLVLKV